MAYKVQAAIVRAKDAPVTIETIIVPKPGPGEVTGPRLFGQGE